MTDSTPEFLPGTRTPDLTGSIFGLLTVLELAGRDKHGRARWRCRCECGEEAIAEAYNLKSGNTTSCGCFHRERQRAAPRKHGQRGTPLYQRWKGMLQRTGNPNSPDYPRYGGRGIAVCERWMSFENFAADMGSTFRDGLTLERIDVNANYSPENCTWATRAEQQRNRRNNRTLTWRGQTMILAAWEESLGLKPGRLSDRLRRGWSVERALTTGADPEALARFDGIADAETRECNPPRNL